MKTHNLQFQKDIELWDKKQEAARIKDMVIHDLASFHCAISSKQTLSTIREIKHTLLNKTANDALNEVRGCLL